MTITASEGTTGQSGLIIPENIPGDDLRPWQLESVAETLRTAGSGAVAQAEVAEASWAGLPGVLESPQGPTIYAALGTPTTAATAIAEKFDRVATALDEFAAALRPIKETFAEIKRDAVEFRATITWDERVWVSPHETKEYEHNGLAMVSTTGDYTTSYSTGSSQSEVLAYLRGRGESARVSGGQVQILAPWTESSEHIDQNNALMDRLADAYTRLQNAEADCANAINRQRDLCMVEIEHIEAWQLKQSGENTVVLPWGSRVEEDRNCGESFWWGVGSAGTEMLEGAGGLIGYNGVRGDWSWEQVGQSWLGAVQGIGSLLVITSPPLLLLGMAGVPVLRDGVAMGGEMLKGLVAWDTWSENPSEAAGRVLVNVGSMFIPGAGQVGAAVKALSAGSRIIDLAGDAARLTDAATTGVTKLDGLVVKLDGLVGDAVGTGLRVDDVVSVGVRTDLPGTDALQVGARTGDTPPSAGAVDDGVPQGSPGRGDDGAVPGSAHSGIEPSSAHDAPASPRSSAGDDTAPTILPDTDAPPGSRPEAADSAAPQPRLDEPHPSHVPVERPPLTPADDGWEPRMDPEKGNNSDGSWDGRGGNHLAPSDNALVQQYFSESIALERRVRPELERIVAEAAPDSTLVGGKEAIKFADSLKDKVARLISADPSLTAADALLQVRDSVRYTVQSSVSEYATTVVHTAARLEAEGFELVKVADTWANDGYKGVNSTWVDPATGRVIEIQFHTAESFLRKTTGHGPYELLRDPGDLTPSEIARLERENAEWFDGLEVPPGAGRLDELLRSGELRTVEGG